MAEPLQPWRAAEGDERRVKLHRELETVLAKSSAADFVRSLPAELHNEEAFQTALRRWAEEDPAEALRWLQTCPERDCFRHISDAAASDWASRNPAEAVDWVASLPSSHERDHLLARLAIGLSRVTPEIAAQFAIDVLPAGENRQHAIEGIAATWARDDPAAAAEWAIGVASSGGDPLRLVLYPWFDQAPTAVDVWLRSLPDAATRDTIRARLIAWQMEKDPAAATASLWEISDKAMQAQMASGLVRRWARDEFERATEWVSRVTPLPLRDRLLADLATVADEIPDPRR